MRFKLLLLLSIVGDPIWSWKHRDVIVREWKMERA